MQDKPLFQFVVPVHLDKDYEWTYIVEKLQPGGKFKYLRQWESGKLLANWHERLGVARVWFRDTDWWIG